MKKKLVVLFLIAVMVLPLQVFAKKLDVKNYKTMNLKQTLKDDEIEASFKNYSENSDQITIYLFRGKGCGFCHAFLTFLDSITDEYGKYFKLVSFEVWYDKDNKDLMGKISKFLGEEAKGVPYIVIGDKAFPGYASSYDEDIKKAIKDLYNTKKSNRYDVFEEYNKKHSSNSSSISSKSAIIFDLVFTVVAAAGVIAFVNYKVDKSQKEILNIVEKNNKTKKTK